MKGSLVISAVVCLVSGPVLADAALELAQGKDCTSCHAVEGVSQAPSFTSIANKYRDRPKEESRLVSTVMWGSPTYGGYHWGTTKMPTPGERSRITESEASQLVHWILSLK